MYTYRFERSMSYLRVCLSAEGAKKRFVALGPGFSTPRMG